MGSYARTYQFTNGTIAYGDQVVFELDAIASSVNNITNAQISSGAGVTDNKFATISTAGKVSGAALTALASIPAGAGVIPAANLPTQRIIQQVITVDQTGRAITASAIPIDSSIPQSGEGAAYSALETTFTPSVSGNRIIVECDFNFTQDSGSGYTVFALFKDSDASALACTVNKQAYDAGGSGYETVPATHGLTLVYTMLASSTSAITFKIRCGATVGTVYANLSTTSATQGNTIPSSMKITEVTV